MSSQRLASIALALLCLQPFLANAETKPGNNQDQVDFSQEAARVNSAVIQKSPNDNRSYAAIMLNNHLQVVVVSDPTLENSAASLAVAVGSAQDPESQPGLAHYLEHMLFLGTQKYPEPDGLSRFIEQNGGSDNASTYSDKTNYFFSINSASFEQALDRFSDYFKSPTFDPVYSDKERNAINNEWSLDRRQDEWNIEHIAQLTINPQSPYAKFDVGNLETLIDKPGSTLQDELKQFYQRYYSANLMRLTLVGKQSVTELKQLAEKYFSAIPNHEVARPETRVPGFTEAQYAKNIYYQPFENIKLLIVEFPVRSNKEQWMFKPNKYLFDLLTSEEPGTLSDHLHAKGYIADLGSDYSTDEYGMDGYFRVQMTLTDIGVKHQDEITAAVFAYIDLVRNQGLNPDYFKQLKAINKKQFVNYSKPNPVQQAEELSIQQLDIPLEHLLDAPYTYQEYKPELIKNLFDQLDIHHVRVWHVDQNEKVDTPVSHFDGTYTVKPITEKEFSHLNELAAGEHFQLPPLNDLFTEDSAPIVANVFLKPHRVISEQGVEAFMVQPEFYREDKGSISIEINSKLPVESAKNCVLQAMMDETFRKRNIALYDRADRAGLSVSIFTSPSGLTGISVSGYTPKHALLVSETLQSFAQLDITLRDFQETQASVIDTLRNKKSNPLMRQAYGQLSLLIAKTHWDDDTLIKAAKQSSLKDLQSYYAKVKQSLLVRIFAAGNYTEDQVRDMAHDAVKRLSGSINPDDRSIKQFKLPHTAQYWNYHDSAQLADDAVLLALFRDTKSDDEQAQLMVLNALLDSDMYRQLRTEEQLAYAVRSQSYPVDDVPGVIFLLQSSNTPIQKIVGRITAFTKDYVNTLQKVEPQRIEQIKQSLLENVLQKPTDFYNEMGRYTNEFWFAKYEFDARYRYIAALQKVTKDDLLNIYRKLILDPKVGRLLIQYRGTHFQQQPFISGGEPVH